MRKFLIYSALAFATAITSMPLGVAPAAAQDLELELDRDGPRLRVRPDCDPDFEDCYGRRGAYEARSRGCTEDRALRKAARMGIRNARVIDVDRRSIEVRGRDRRGDRVHVTFGRRDRSCPVW